MPRLSRLFAILFVSLPFLAAGCKTLNEDKNLDLDDGNTSYQTIPAAGSDKQVVVTATADPAAVEIFVVPGGPPDVNKDVSKMKDLLAKTDKPSKDISLTFEVKAKQECTVCIVAMKKTKVHLKMTNK